LRRTRRSRRWTDAALRGAWVAALAALAALPAAGAPAATAEAGASRVIVVSLDGTTPAAARDARVASLEDLARRGARAERLVPVFPTNTFPNHVSLVTGVAPEVHGIVNNVFLDPVRGLFRYANDPDWIEVEPIWSIAARHGVVSAAYHWVGSEGAWRGGGGPRHWVAFDATTRESEKVAQVLAWLDIEDPGARPRLITTWFRGADRVAHRYGPDSPRVGAALREQGEALAQLVAGIEARDGFATTTLFVVSDHGMAAVERSVDLDAALREVGVAATVLGAGGVVFATVPGGAEDVEKVLRVARSLSLEAYARAEAPPLLRLANPRFGDVVVLAPNGTAIASASGPKPDMRGAHGYRPEAPGMGALFLAAGRGVRPGLRLGEVRAVDVAPTVLALLGVEAPRWMEGRVLPLGGAEEGAR
jgi:predicted AlkP superfamily pyrophosphatase or phosphodiesterase